MKMGEIIWINACDLEVYRPLRGVRTIYRDATDGSAHWYLHRLTITPMERGVDNDSHFSARFIG
jgi:hypothetical protein